MAGVNIGEEGRWVLFDAADAEAAAGIDTTCVDSRGVGEFEAADRSGLVLVTGRVDEGETWWTGFVLCSLVDVGGSSGRRLVRGRVDTVEGDVVADVVFLAVDAEEVVTFSALRSR